MMVVQPEVLNRAQVIRTANGVASDGGPGSAAMEAQHDAAVASGRTPQWEDLHELLRGVMNYAGYPLPAE